MQTALLLRADGQVIDFFSVGAITPDPDPEPEPEET